MCTFCSKTSLVIKGALVPNFVVRETGDSKVDDEVELHWLNVRIASYIGLFLGNSRAAADIQLEPRMQTLLQCRDQEQVQNMMISFNQEAMHRHAREKLQEAAQTYWHIQPFFF